MIISELTLAILSLDTSPILSEKDAKQILRTRREDRPRKAGFPDEPMRVIYDIYYSITLTEKTQHQIP